MTYQYNYPRPMVTVDILALRVHSGKLQILFIRRKNDPFAGKWALPGGFVGMKERLLEAAFRELKEETGLSRCQLLPLIQADEPDRDPRGRTISHIFGTILINPLPAVKAGDDAVAAKWFLLTHLPDLAFDHRYIVNQSLLELKYLTLFKLAVLDFFNENFSRGELENICSALFDRSGISTKILEVALSQKMIHKSGPELYQKTNRKKMIQPPDFFSLLIGG
jgi:8-oxo-dGTP diphosphatase